MRKDEMHIGHPLGEEMTLCGYAIDAFVENGDDEMMRTAREGELITCPDCRRVIQSLRKGIRRWRVVAEER